MTTPISKLARAPEFVFLNAKHGRMVGYGIIHWAHPRSSPFSGENMPVTSKIFTLGRDVTEKGLEPLMRRIELIMMKFGHLNFGAIIGKGEEDLDKLDLLKKLGYTNQLIVLDHTDTNIYLIKELKLLPPPSHKIVE